MKSPKKQYDYRKEIPWAVLNWMFLGWVLLFLILEATWEILPVFYLNLLRALMIMSFLFLGLLFFKGTRWRFILSSKTDSHGWIIRTGKKLKSAARKLAINYPTLVKTIKLKDSTYKVTVTKKYKYHQNPTSVEEID